MPREQARMGTHDQALRTLLRSTSRGQAHPLTPLSCVPCVRVRPCRWGSKLGPKLFVARKFVVKHIRTKQEDKLQSEKERVSVRWACDVCVCYCAVCLRHAPAWV